MRPNTYMGWVGVEMVGAVTGEGERVGEEEATGEGELRKIK